MMMMMVLLVEGVGEVQEEEHHQEKEEDGDGGNDDDDEQQKQQEEEEPMITTIDDDEDDENNSGGEVDHHYENENNDHSPTRTTATDITAYNNYEYEERILISSPRRTSRTPRQQQQQQQHYNYYDVRLESYSSLLLKLKNESSLSSAAMIVSPFPDKILQLLQQQQQSQHNDDAVVTKIRLQIQNRATSKAGDKVLDTIPPLGLELEQEDNNNVLLSGPSGVYVSVQFAAAVANDSQNDDNNMRMHYHKKKFMKILKRMIGSDRILLASLSTIQEKRTRRYIDVVNNVAKQGIVEVSTILPLQGSSTPLAAEGLQAFLNLLPCSGRSSRNGIFGVADATTWSNLLLGIGLPSNKIKGGGRATSSTKNHLEVISDDLRGLWFDFRRRPDSGGDQQYTISQGIYYSLMNTTTKSITEPSVHDDDTRHSHTQHHHHGVQDISLKDIIPTVHDELSTCPFADTTTAVNLVGLDGDDENESEVVLLQRKHKLSEPLFSFSSSSSSSATVAAALPPTTTWEVHMDVLRSSSNGGAGGAGAGGGGTIISSLYNYHPKCSANVKFYQTIPLSIIKPVWQSLIIQSNTGSNILQLPSWNHNHLRVEEESSDNNDPTTILIEFEYDIQASTSIHLSLGYQPSFLSFENFPADPNRGFEINPFKARFQLSPECAATAAASNAKSQQQLLPGQHSSPLWLYSNSVLILIPVPDMSMPFNVLSLTCTIYAFVVGAMINLLIRRASERVKNTLHPPPAKKKLLVRIKERMRTKLTKIMGKSSSGSKKEETEGSSGGGEEKVATATNTTASTTTRTPPS